MPLQPASASPASQEIWYEDTAKPPSCTQPGTITCSCVSVITWSIGAPVGGPGTSTPVDKYVGSDQSPSPRLIFARTLKLCSVPGISSERMNCAIDDVTGVEYCTPSAESVYPLGGTPLEYGAAYCTWITVLLLRPSSAGDTSAGAKPFIGLASVV